jgi:C-terminal processing protease CtpA/Prc
VASVFFDRSWDLPGATVRSVSPDSPADTAGIVVDDVVTAIDGAAVLTMDELFTTLRRVGAGDSVAVSLQDGDPVAVTLATRWGAISTPFEELVDKSRRVRYISNDQTHIEPFDDCEFIR